MVSKILLLLRITCRKIKQAFKKNVPIEPQVEVNTNHVSKCMLNADRVYITDKIYVRIPSVGEAIEDEQLYYGILHALTSVPYQNMVLLDDAGLDYTEISEYELFCMVFPSLAKTDLSIIFGDLNTSDYDVYYDNSNSTTILYSPTNGMDYKIDEFVYKKLSDTLRKINNIEKVKFKPGNEEAKRYLLEKERKRQKRNANKPYEPYLEKLVVALVNRTEFKYNYEETMNLSMYKFNQSFKQIQTSITFDNTMIGVYAGTVDTSKMKDKSCLSWIPIK